MTFWHYYFANIGSNPKFEPANQQCIMKRYYNKLIRGKDKCTILLYGEIGDEYGYESNIVSEIIEAQNIYANIDVRINSRGGEVFAGIAIYNALRTCKGNVRIYIDGLAASMASVIAFCGHHVEMSRHARLMLHCVSGTCCGNTAELQKCIREISNIEQTLCDIYSTKLHLTPNEVKRRYFDGEDHWITADEALKMGLIDGVFDIDAEPQGNAPDDIYDTFMARLEKQPDSNTQKNSVNSKFKGCISRLLGIPDGEPDENIYKAVKKLKKAFDAKSDKETITDAVKMGWIDQGQSEMFMSLAKHNPKAFKSYIAEKQQSDAVVIENLIAAAENKGKIYANERHIYKAVGDAMGARMLGQILSIKPAKRMVMRDLNLHKEDRSKWTFEDWRTYAPEQLCDNPELYDRLREKEGQEQLSRDLNWYRRNDPQYLQENPELYKHLIEKQYNKRH